MATRSRKSKICTVVGGCGFLGRHMVEYLLSKGYQVNVFDINVTFSDDRVKFFTGDLTNKEDVLPAVKGVGIVFHHASPQANCTDRNLFHTVNVEGTKVLISACIESGVQKFILTSSASVVYDGSDVINGTEDLPYANKPLDYYTESKILQEKYVLSCNNTCPEKGPVLMTVAIRPHGIIGPRDVQNIPVIAEAAKNGRTKFMIGNGKNLVNFTYVDNVVLGHVMASDHLYPDSVVCGQAYNITNNEPIEFRDYMERIVTGIGYPPPTVVVSYHLLLAIAVLLDMLVWLVSPCVTIKPLLTRARVKIAGTHHYFSSNKAQNHFGYSPIVNYEDGVEKSLEAFKLNSNLH